MLNILIVDDSKLARKRVLGIIEEIKTTEANIYEAVDGVDGLKKFQELKPNLIISDIEMPNMDGITLTKEIRKLDQEIPIIVISSIANEQVKQSIKSDSNIHYFKKPIPIKQLEIALLRIENNIMKG